MSQQQQSTSPPRARGPWILTAAFVLLVVMIAIGFFLIFLNTPKPKANEGGDQSRREAGRQEFSKDFHLGGL